MQSMHIDFPGQEQSFEIAHQLAREAARKHNMSDPTVITWHQRGSSNMAHAYDGANPDSWWSKYGQGNGGGLEISVGDRYEFVLMDTQGFETIDQLPIRHMVDDKGNGYICLAPMLGNKTTPDHAACMPLDEWMADQY